jgi:hypothetical protein
MMEVKDIRFLHLQYRSLSDKRSFCNTQARLPLSSMYSLRTNIWYAAQALSATFRRLAACCPAHDTHFPRELEVAWD